MDRQTFGRAAAALVLGGIAAAPSAWAGSPVQIGASGQTFASAAVLCLADPASGTVQAAVQAGLHQPARRSRGTVRLDGSLVARVTAARPATTVTLTTGAHDVAVRQGRGATDHFRFDVADGRCVLPDTSGNAFSADGTLEFAASGKSHATVAPGCALNPATGEVQPFVNLFVDGSVLLNVSVNGVPLTQLGPQHPSTPVFLQAGFNVVSAVNGNVSVDHYVRDAGDGACAIGP